MNRREFVRTAGIVATGVSLAGCPGGDGGDDDSPSVIEGGQADVRTSIVHGAPQDQAPYEDSVELDVPEQDSVLVLRELVFQRGGPRGIVVAGEATNTGDRQLEAVLVTTTLYNVGDANGAVQGSKRLEESRVGLDAGATWQWAMTFNDPPVDVDYFGIDAIANYD